MTQKKGCTRKIVQNDQDCAIKIVFYRTRTRHAFATASSIGAFIELGKVAQLTGLEPVNMQTPRSKVCYYSHIGASVRPLLCSFDRYGRAWFVPHDPSSAANQAFFILAFLLALFFGVKKTGLHICVIFSADCALLF